MEESMRIYAKVDLDAIEHNINEMEKLQDNPVPMMAVIKTNGYGHGAVEIAHLLEKNSDICGFAVATAEEAMELRDAGITKMILILGFVFEKDYARLIEHEIRFCVFRYDLAKKISDMAVEMDKKAYVHIKIDTGMGRIGFVPGADAVSEIIEIAKLKGICMEGIFTHFARADETDKSYTQCQFAKFLDMIHTLKEQGVTFAIHHCANSAAILELPECAMDMVRAGITLYGLCPSEEVGRKYDLQPALSLYSHIVHIKEISEGDCISYGGTYQATEKRRVATVPVGYGDGYPRAMSGKGFVLIHGKRAPILGRVCMDQMMVDVTDIPQAELLDLVVLIGQDGKERITMEEVGEISGRFNYELACDLGNRIPRFYYHREKLIGKLDFFA
ncbi:MAG: alanine racemase [Lachnospiraceae bacterium]|nr:alanine racemase [Lachnospiraceae bacterium]